MQAARISQFKWRASSRATGTRVAAWRRTNSYVRFGSKADIAALPTNVRFTPKSGHRNSALQCLLCAKSGLMHCSMKSLFDHVVGALPQEQRHVEAERLGGFQIDHQLELVRSLDGELARFCALEDAVTIGCCTL